MKLVIGLKERSCRKKTRSDIRGVSPLLKAFFRNRKKSFYLHHIFISFYYQNKSQLRLDYLIIAVVFDYILPFFYFFLPFYVFYFPFLNASYCILAIFNVFLLFFRGISSQRPLTRNSRPLKPLGMDLHFVFRRFSEKKLVFFCRKELILFLLFLTFLCVF